MRHRVSSLVVSVCIVVGLPSHFFFAGGCEGIHGGHAAAPTVDAAAEPDLPPPAEPTEGSIFERRLQRRTIEFKVTRFSGPRGTFTNDDELWKLVSGTLPNAGAALHLSDNGFRAAIGRKAHRQPLIDALARRPDLSSVEDRAFPDVSREVILEMGQCPPGQAIFHIDRAGRLHGQDFLSATVRMRMTCAIRSTNLDEILLRLTPTIQDPPGPAKWRVAETGAQQWPEERRQVYDDLAFEARVPEGGFLLLGPTPVVYDRPLVARPYFIEEIGPAPGGEKVFRESIYVIDPIISVTGGPAGGGRRGDAAEKEREP